MLWKDYSGRPVVHTPGRGIRQRWRQGGLSGAGGQACPQVTGRGLELGLQRGDEERCGLQICLGEKGSGAV